MELINDKFESDIKALFNNISLTDEELKKIIIMLEEEFVDFSKTEILNLNNIETQILRNKYGLFSFGRILKTSVLAAKFGLEVPVILYYERIINNKIKYYVFTLFNNKLKDCDEETILSKEIEFLLLNNNIIKVLKFNGIKNINDLKNIDIAVLNDIFDYNNEIIDEILNKMKELGIKKTNNNVLKRKNV